jgi:hypothetical protein
MKRGRMRVALVAVVLVVGSWGINAAFSSPGWACNGRTTGFDGWPARSTALEDVLATVDPPDSAVVHHPERVSDDFYVRQYLVNGEIVQEVRASRDDGQWGIDSVTSC